MWSWILASLSWFVGLLGIVDIFSALYPPQMSRYAVLREFLPLDILHLSRTLTLIFGIALLSLAKGLHERKHRAWLMSLILLIATLIFHLIKGLDIEEFGLTALAVTLLLYFRPYFYVQSDRLMVIATLKKFFLTFSLLFLYTFLGFAILRNQYSTSPNFASIRQDYFYNSFGLGQDHLVSHNRWARWFESSVSVVSVTALSLMLFALFAPVFDKYKPSSTAHNRLKDILQENEGGELGYYALMGDKKIWFDETMTHAVAYQVAGSHCIVLGCPLGEPDLVGTSWQFQEYMTRHGYRTTWYGQESPSLAADLHLHAIKMGEAALISLPDFKLEGPAIADIRHAVTHLAKSSPTSEWYTMSNLPWRQLKDIDTLYSDWSRAKKAPSLTFSLGFYPLPVIDEGQVLVVRAKTGEIWAALTFFPSGKSSFLLDLMMRSPGSPNGVIEYAITQAIEHFRTLGLETLNLGTAPLADVTPSSEVALVKALRNTLFDRFNHFYGYKSLYKFKSKFNPTWSPRYIYVHDYVGLPSYMGAILAVHLRKTKSL